MLMEQKAACDGMVDEKNKLIHDFQQVNKFQYLSSVFFSTILNVQFRKISIPVLPPQKGLEFLGGVGVGGS